MSQTLRKRLAESHKRSGELLSWASLRSLRSGKAMQAEPTRVGDPMEVDGEKELMVAAAAAVDVPVLARCGTPAATAD
eukprot:6476878-Amphidinium_carterae.1